MSNYNVEPQNAEFKGNHNDFGHAPTRWGSQILRRSKRTFKGIYDFAVQGGAIGTIGLYDPVFGKLVALSLPASFILTDIIIDCVTALTSGGAATVAITSGQSAGDILTATAYNAAPFTGVITCSAASAASFGAANTSTAIKVPSTQASPGSAVSLVIAAAALTAGQVVVHLEGFLSDLL
jgi:hypothetical protein